MAIRVFDLMDTSPPMAEVPSPRAHLLELFSKSRVRGLPVVKAGSRKLAGIVLRSDLLRQPEQGEVAFLMNPNPMTMYAQAPIREAAQALHRGDVPLLPVVTAANDLLGIVTPDGCLPSLTGNRGLVQTYVRQRVVPVHESTPVRAAHVVHRITRASALPVVDDDGKLVGILTDGDLLRHAEVEHVGNRPLEGPAERLRLPTFPVKRIMVRPVVSVRRTSTVGEAAKTMLDYGWHQLPVVDDAGALLDLVTDLDLLGALL